MFFPVVVWSLRHFEHNLEALHSADASQPLIYRAVEIDALFSAMRFQAM